MSIDIAHWAGRLEELAREHRVPGASLAVLADGQVHSAATGVLNVETGVEATTDSLFQLGSISKVYTATVIMRLAEAGKLDIDAPLVNVLPGFEVADADVTKRVTARHLLSHTSGIGGDFMPDTGRGDDALERFLELCPNVGQDAPLGVTQSYSNAGYMILGRLIEVLTELTWDDAVRDELFAPAGLAHTATLPERVFRHRAAWGHEPGEDGSLEPVEEWDMARSSGPAGSINASAGDLIAFVKLHLDGGVAADGTRLLSALRVAEMQSPQVNVPDHSIADHWGLGWLLRDVNGRRVFGHGGNGSGQNAFLQVVPDRGVAIALLTNGGNDTGLGPALFRELLSELAGIQEPPAPAPADAGGQVDERVLGAYERFGVRVNVEPRDGALLGTLGLAEPLKSQHPDYPGQEIELEFSNSGANVYVAKMSPDAPLWTPFVFFEAEGNRYLHFGGRAMRRVGD